MRGDSGGAGCSGCGGCGRARHAGDALILPADLADPGAAVSALLSAETGVLTDEDGRPQWLLARAPILALRARVAELRASGASLAGLSARDLLGALPGRLPAAAAACADIDTRDDAAEARRLYSKELAYGTV